MDDFSFALHHLKLGACITRASWPEDMFLYLVPGSSFKVNREPLLSLLPEGTDISYRGHIDLFFGKGNVMVWTPCQVDLLACDYYIVQPNA